MTHQVSNTEKLRVITRRDLPIGTQATQAAHAAIDFQHENVAELTAYQYDRRVKNRFKKARIARGWVPKVKTKKVA